MRRSVTGAIAALASMAVLTAVMLPLRSHLSIATTALVLVVPVVVGVASGGFGVGAASVIAGFVVYDFLFIPPHLTLSVGPSQDWVALGVYAAVMLLVARVVDRMNAARGQARRQGRELRELFGLSDLLVADKPLEVLLPAVTATLAEAFDCEQVALLLPDDGDLQVVASTGEPLSDEQLRRISPSAGELGTLQPPTSERGDLLVVVLAAAGRPIGLLALSTRVAARYEREPLLLFANHVALAVERAQLRDQALQSRLSQEVGRLARTLVAAVSHDLRTPLASIKAASSTLADPDLDLDADAGRQLATLVDVQADRLAELVQNLLDMSRIQAGVLEPRTTVASLTDLVAGVVDDLGPALRGHTVRVEIPAELPPADVDVVLVTRVFANLLDNAARHAPKRSTITVGARTGDGDGSRLEVSVTDQGPGVTPDRHHEIFELFSRRPGDAGVGLGLTIAKTFIEAHGCRIWIDTASETGARFLFTLPVAASLPEEATRAADPHH